METNLCIPGNKSKAHNVVGLLGICQCKKELTGYGCSCSEMKLEYRKDSYIQQTLFVSFPHQQNLVAHVPLLIV